MVSKQHEKYWNKSLSLSKLAIKNNYLMPISTELKRIRVNHEISFELRKTTSTNFKSSNIFGPRKNPFCPWDINLEIELIGGEHVLILNKYPVQIGHMLLITKTWKPQDGWLEKQDLKALLTVEADTSGLWFFNSCPKSGASQPHRHIQLLRRSSKERICPLESWYNRKDSEQILQHKILSRNIFSTLRTINMDSSNTTYFKYLDLCERAGLGNPKNNEKPDYPYNLLITPSWMAIIRRSKEFAYGFGLNALAFAGYLLSTGQSDELWLERNGPITLLEEVVADNLI